jgi:hypothetical protein
MPQSSAQVKPLVNDTMISMMDILPIVAEAAGAPLDMSGTDAVPMGERRYIVSEAFDLDAKKDLSPGHNPHV